MVRFIVLLGLLNMGGFALAENIRIQPAPGSSVIVTDASGQEIRLEVTDAGAIRIPGLGTAATVDETPICYDSATGTLGNCPPGAIEGPPGPPGPQGETGPVGPQGEAGPTGPAGSEGPMGPAGAQGEQGPVGPQGEQGPEGPVGPAGEQGPVGSQGPEGPPGPQGLQGETGPQGPQGETGPAGPQGEAGPTGPAGPEGPMGPAGPQGEQGPEGPQGESGPAGPEGPAGPAGSRGEQGLEGPAGPPGEQGPAGISGYTIASRDCTMAALPGDSSRAFCAATANCPSGRRVLGGGVDGGTCFVGSVNVSAPSGTSSWVGIFVGPASCSGDGVRVQAICAAVTD